MNIFLRRKRKAFAAIHRGKAWAEETFRQEQDEFNFGNLSQLTVFRDSHPAVMQERIRQFNWADQLERNRRHTNAVQHRHEKLKYRVLTFIEQHFLGGRQIFSFKNYRLK